MRLKKNVKIIDMNIEEKAKAYDEALEKARIYRDNAKAVEEYSSVARYENIFPELRESEDERIRKRIVLLVEQFAQGLNKGPMLAYLEKQKEQKPDIELIQQSWYMEGYQDREHNLEPEWIVKIGEGGPRYEENPKYGQPLAEMQKPAEKQDYSGLNDCERAIHRGFLAAGVENVPVSIIKETTKDCIAHFPWPTKWSKEDEKIRHCIGLILADAPEKRFKDYNLNLKECLVWLGNNGANAEWSEDDVRNLNRAIFYTRYYQRTKGATDGSEECVAWLKSLRPSWKPSEEQMSMLLAVINEPNNSGASSCQIALRGIYEQLKKL